MDPNLKLIFDELKTVSASMGDLKTSLEHRIDGVEKALGDRFSSLEQTASLFDAWKPKVEASVEDLRVEVGALRKIVNRVVLDSASPSLGLFPKPGSTAAISAAGNPVDGPAGHRVDSSHRGHVYGSVYTHTHLPVTGMPAPPNPKLHRSVSHPHLEIGGSGGSHVFDLGPDLVPVSCLRWIFQSSMVIIRSCGLTVMRCILSCFLSILPNGSRLLL